MLGGPAIRKLLIKDRRLVFRNRKIITNSPECCAACSGLRFWRARPCVESTGCSQPPTGFIYVSTTQKCLDGSPIGDVIGFDSICWIVEKGGSVFEPCKDWHECTQDTPPVCCLPADAMVLNPDLLVYCTSDCDSGDCGDYIPGRYIRLVPCPGSAEGAPTWFIDSLLGYFGCGVYATGDGRCWIVDCSNAQTTRPPEDQLNPVLAGPVEDCCHCLCIPTPAYKGCDEAYPDDPLTECCCPPEPVAGMRMEWHVERRTREIGSYHTVLVQVLHGSATWVERDGSLVVESDGTRNDWIEYGPGNCDPFPVCPPSGCRLDLLVNEPAVIIPECPPPMWMTRPCPNNPERPGETWEGSRTCDTSEYSYSWVNPVAPNCQQGGTVSITEEGVFVLTGVGEHGCSGGCSGGRMLALKDLPRKTRRDPNSPCSGCGSRELRPVAL